MHLVSHVDILAIQRGEGMGMIPVRFQCRLRDKDSLMNSQ